MIDPTELRIAVRTMLATRRADELVPEPLLHAALEKFFNRRVEAGEMARALEWNKARGWAESRWNDDHERDEWKLTERGRTKEGL